MQPTPNSLDAAPVIGPIAEINSVKIERKHSKSFDFLRDISVLSKCLYYFSGVALLKVTNVYMKLLLAGGWLDVDTFLIILGFIISFSLLGKKRSMSQIGPCLAKRTSALTDRPTQPWF